MERRLAAALLAFFFGLVGAWFFGSVKRSYDYHYRPEPNPKPVDRLWRDVPQTEDGETLH